MDADSVARLRKVVGRLARHLNVSAADEGLTPSQASVLASVAGHGPLGISELAELEGLNPTMLSRVVGKLDEGDLIHRVRDPDDLRAARVEVTAAGKRLHERIKDRRASLVSQCVENLPARQAGDLVRALSALEALAEELARQGR